MASQFATGGYVEFRTKKNNPDVPGVEDIQPDELLAQKDKVLVVAHDPSLERTTDVETRFPVRATTVTDAAGRSRKVWYIEDFKLAEIRQLDNGAWFDAKFAGRKVLTFQEAIDLLKGKVGIIPELKNPRVTF